MSTQVEADAWWPAQRNVGWCSTGNLKEGRLVIFDRQPYRVVEIRDVEHVDWPEKYREAWVKHNMPDPDTWYSRPMVVVVRHEERPNEKPLHLGCPASTTWKVLPEHYSVCRLCRELPPCSHEHNEKVMASATKRMQLQMAILPGHCHACREPVTRRQKSFTFPGPNLIRPDLGDNSARFHMRQQCEEARIAYDERWAKATGRRQFFYCPGHWTEHYDGSTECSDPECPGDVRHARGSRHARFRDMRGVAWASCWCMTLAKQEA
jgi:hypothetical protein